MKSTQLFQFLDTVGDGTGDKNAISDYSSGQNFLLTCPANVSFIELYRGIVYIEDSGNFSSAGYGNLSGLSNGIEARLEKIGETIDLTDGQPIKTNAEWSKICYDVNYVSFGSGNNALSVRWTFARAGAPFKLYPGESLVFYLSDDLTGLVQHTFFIQGQITW